MKLNLLIIFSLIFLLSFWIISFLFFSGIIPNNFIPSYTLPRNTSELGDSFNILQSFFSTISVALALIAVLFQGKEIRESSEAEREKTSALLNQFENQKILTLISAYSTLMQSKTSRLERNENFIGEIKKEASEAQSEDLIAEKWSKIKSINERQKLIKNEITDYEKKIESLLKRVN